MSNSLTTPLFVRDKIFRRLGSWVIFVVEPKFGLLQKKQKKELGAAVRAQLRQDRIVSEGLFATDKGDAVKHCVTFEGKST